MNWGTIALRNRVNHLILNRIMVARYQLRKKPGCVRMLIGLEALCLRAGLIYIGRGRSGNH